MSLVREMTELNKFFYWGPFRALASACTPWISTTVGTICTELPKWLEYVSSFPSGILKEEQMSHENQCWGAARGARNRHLPANAFLPWHQKWWPPRSWRPEVHPGVLGKQVCASSQAWDYGTIASFANCGQCPHWLSCALAESSSFMFVFVLEISKALCLALSVLSTPLIPRLDRTTQLSQPSEEKTIQLDQVFLTGDLKSTADLKNKKHAVVSTKASVSLWTGRHVCQCYRDAWSHAAPPRRDYQYGDGSWPLPSTT